MRQTTHFTIALLRRILDFLQRTQPASEMGELTTHITQLAALTDELSDLAIEQETRRRQGRAGTSTLRRQLRAAKFEYMRPVWRMARVLFPDDATARGAMSVPAKLFRPEHVISALHGMAATAEAHKAAFTAGGFIEDFIDRMHGAADSIKSAVDARSRDYGRSAAASGGSVRLAQRGRAMVRLIDAMVGPRLQGNPELFAEWRSLLRQGQVRETAESASTETPNEPSVPFSGPTPPAPTPPTSTPPNGGAAGTVVTPITSASAGKSGHVLPALAA
ncbi:MAG: hypothetical protein ABIT38_05065 [Gemmatimonadaceae bacterium]